MTQLFIIKFKDPLPVSYIFFLNFCKRRRCHRRDEEDFNLVSPFFCSELLNAVSGHRDIKRKKDRGLISLAFDFL